MAKQHDEVSGDGYECSLVKLKRLLTSTFYNPRLPPVVSTEKIKITKEHCNMMVQFKMCAKKHLICIGDTCRTQFTPDSELEKYYGWWKTNVLTEDICTLKKIKVIAENENTEIFAKGCTATKEYCELEDSVIVWNKIAVIHQCPYEIIGEYPMQRKENNIMDTYNEDLVFEIMEEKTVCHKTMPMTVYKTTEGLYLTKAETFEARNYKVNKNKTQITTSEFLTLALIDNNAYKQIENYRELNVRNCYSLLNHLNLVRQTVNEQFYRLKDLSGDDSAV